jgi:methionyl-tRNA synthetase
MIHRALEEIWKLVMDANAYIDVQAPWTLKKTDPERMKTVLYVLCEAIRCLAILIQPVTPQSASAMLDQIKIPQDQRDFAALTAHPFKGGESIEEPKGVFPRIIEEEQKAAG